MEIVTVLAVLLQCLLIVNAQPVVIADLWKPDNAAPSLSSRQDGFGATLIQKPDKTMYVDGSLALLTIRQILR